MQNFHHLNVSMTTATTFFNRLIFRALLLVWSDPPNRDFSELLLEDGSFIMDVQSSKPTVLKQ